MLISLSSSFDGQKKLWTPVMSPGVKITGDEKPDAGEHRVTGRASSPAYQILVQAPERMARKRKKGSRFGSRVHEIRFGGRVSNFIPRSHRRAWRAGREIEALSIHEEREMRTSHVLRRKICPESGFPFLPLTLRLFPRIFDRSIERDRRTTGTAPTPHFICPADQESE